MTLYYLSEDPAWSAFWIPDQLVEEALRDAVDLIVAVTNSKLGPDSLVSNTSTNPDKFWTRKVTADPEIVDWTGQNPDNFHYILNYATILQKRKAQLPATKSLTAARAEATIGPATEWIRNNAQRFKSRSNTQFPNKATGFTKLTSTTQAYKNLLKTKILSDNSPTWKTGVIPNWI